jgi:tRNA-dihydrouridine synthase
MRTPLKVARIFRKLSRALEIPVTAKIRLGLDADCLTYKLIARIVQEEGGQLLAIHARTRKQGYYGQANWDAVAEVAQSLSIPVIGNGDVKTVADIERMKVHTGCAGVMIGRAAVSNPWIFSRLDREQVSAAQVRELMLRHLARSLDFYGPARGLKLFRKYAANYLSPYGLSKEQRQKLLTREKPEAFLTLLDEILDDGMEELNGLGN